MRDIVNPKNAHKWRAETLKLLHPEPAKIKEHDATQVMQATDQMIAQRAQYSANKFFDSPVSILIDKGKLKDKAKKRVRTMFVNAAKLAYKLWTSKTWVVVMDAKELPETFSTDGNSMKAHPLVDFEGDMSKLVGQKIDLVAHPLLLIYGNNEGEKYEEYRVLMPAEVLCQVS
jgi:hypothetical protein